MPCEFAEAYFTENWEKHDPELYYAQRTQSPFTWASLPQLVRLTTGQRRVIDAASAHGLRDGLCVPLGGTDGRLDTISLVSSCKGNDIDPAHRNAVAFLGLRALARYIELTEERGIAAHLQAAKGLSPHSSAIYELDDLLCDPFALTPQHLRALALVDIGARRWRGGLTELASRVYLLRKSRTYGDLERWGLIVDETDDVRWRYYFAPSVLGLSYLRRSPDATGIRGESWLRDLVRHEVPDGLEAS